MYRLNPETRLNELLDAARAGGTPASIERRVVKELVRYYHGISPENRRLLVEREPDPTGTVWDAVVAATVEHVCWTHGDPRPAWTQNDNRFLGETWIPGQLESSRADSLCNSPAAFIRHNALIDPRSLDERSGDRHVWRPDKRDNPGAVRRSEREAEDRDRTR